MDYKGMIEKARHEIDRSLSARRAGHIYAVEEETALLVSALCRDENAEAMTLAALIHDITKDKTFEENLKLCDECGIILSDDDLASPKVIHGKSAAGVARRDYGLGKEYADAVFYHTTGRANMTLAEKIIYISDYIEKTRTHENCVRAREMLHGSLGLDYAARIRALDETMLFTIMSTFEYLESRGLTVHPDSKSALIYFKNIVKK